ncbi:MAG: HK97 family phage prohead protease [Clostridia bacterium]|nr:HK97 family phage prohead protease [Clostridia bacterium]
MDQDKRKIQRSYRPTKLERIVRQEEEGKQKLVLRGYPIVFGVEATVYDWWYGEIKETILPTALDGVDLSNVYLLRSHDSDKVLGKNGVNMRLEVDETGLFFECELLDTQIARDTYAEVEAGLIDGMSFGCYLSDKINDATMTRTITHIDELIEITITPFPAYKEASVVAKTSEEKRESDSAEEAEREKFIKAMEEL